MTTGTAPTSEATQAMRDGIVAIADTQIVFDYVRAGHPEGIKFDVWYCDGHLPALAERQDVRRVRRYAAPALGSYLSGAEVDERPSTEDAPIDASALPSMFAHHERLTGEPFGAQRRRDVSAEAFESAIAYPAFLRAPQDRMQEVGRWYDEEHLPLLLSCPQWVMTRRFRIRSARDAARNTPWRDKLLAQGWFALGCRVCYRVSNF